MTKFLCAFLNKYKRNKPAVAGLFIFISFLIPALIANILFPQGPMYITFKSFQPPSLEFPLGTDNLGRSTVIGVIYGARISILVGLLAATFSTGIGLAIGATAGYIGGRVDDVLSRVTETFMIVPDFFLALMLVAVFGANIWNIIAVISVLSWPGTTRVVRGEILSLREQDFVTAARSMGVSKIRIVFSEILPNVVPAIIVSGSLEVGRAMLTEASISFLGLGDPSVQSLGYMLENSIEFINVSWWTTFFPGIALSLLILSANLIGDGLNDALNPRR